MSKRFVPIIMGSDKDYDFATGIGKVLDRFGVPFNYRVCSAEKNPEYLIEMVRKYDSSHGALVYETVAGRSNKLSGVVKGLTPYPVIACPPDSDKAALQMDIWSSLRAPSDSSVMTVLGAGNAALAAVDILALTDSQLMEELIKFKGEVMGKIQKADEAIRNRGKDVQ